LQKDKNYKGETKKKLPPWGRFPKWITEKKWAKKINPAEFMVVAWFSTRASFDVMKLKIRPGKVAADLGYKERQVYTAIENLLFRGILKKTDKRWVYTLSMIPPNTESATTINNNKTNDKEDLGKQPRQQPPHTCPTALSKKPLRREVLRCTADLFALYCRNELRCTAENKLRCTAETGAKCPDEELPSFV